MRVSARCRQGVVAVLAVGFFVNVNLRLRPDGSGKMLISYPRHSLMSHESEGSRFGSSVSSLTGFVVRGEIAYSRVRFSDLNRLVEAPELQNTVLGFQADEEGGGLFWGVLRGAQIFESKSPNSASVKVTFPGPVVEANAVEVSRWTARWEAPVGQFFSWDGIALVARFSSPTKRVASATLR